MLNRRFCWVILAIALLTTACSPQFDWRTVRNDEGHYTVMLPAKPLLNERVLTIAGHALKMQMQTATVGDAMFAVGVVVLPADDPTLRAQVLTYLQSGLARNVGAQPVLHVVRIPGSHDAGDKSRIAMDVAGSVAHRQTQEQRTIHAQFVARDRRVYQAAVVSTREPDPVQLEQFFASLKVD
ncbi:hypothetical protein IHE31_14345 [Mycetohabitans rhizoxinica]